jgi:hypothetical protein
MLPLQDVESRRKQSSHLFLLLLLTYEMQCRIGEPCTTCKQRAAKTCCDAHILCFRPNLADCGFYRVGKMRQSGSVPGSSTQLPILLGSSLHPQPVNRSMSWITRTPILLQFLCAPPQWDSNPLIIPCGHFRPRDTDIDIKHIGGTNADTYLSIPTYAAVDLSYLKAEIRRNIWHFTDVFYSNTIANTSPRILKRTLEIAIAFSVP